MTNLRFKQIPFTAEEVAEHRAELIQMASQLQGPHE